ncbi:MAG: 30S ribosomal protein S2 [Rickettsiales bacterium]|jgi:small subunit ribosomal protein S2|nr:30S ribosomal protein S2 [Rickettsiales bacterium]
MANVPSISIKELIEVGAHFGHSTRRWNPKMEQYIFGKKNGIHIIDLAQTAPMLHRALYAIKEIAANGGKFLFVATKKQAQEIVKEEAALCGQYFVNERWLGGMITNYKTISKSIRKLEALEKNLAEGKETGYTKKELSNMQKEYVKLNAVLGGIRTMGGAPDAVIVIDVCKDDLAVVEANRAGIPVFGICDTNANPNNITFPIPGNDDALRAIRYYANTFAKAILAGLSEQLQNASKHSDKISEAIAAAPVATKETEKIAEEITAETFTK